MSRTHEHHEHKVHGRKMKVLVVTPEITYIPAGMGNISTHLSAKAGGMADVSATLVKALFPARRGRP